MKWHFLFRKKRNKKENQDQSYVDTKSKLSKEKEYKTEITIETFPHSVLPKFQPTQPSQFLQTSKSSREYLHEGEFPHSVLPKFQPTQPSQFLQTSKSSREYLHEGELLSGEEFGPGTPDSDISDLTGTVRAEELSANTPILTDNNRDETLAFCPHCHTLVQPITKKRAQIRTNPWLCGDSGNLKARKRPRLSDITQQTITYPSENMQSRDPLPSASISMSDSGIFDPHTTQSDASVGGLHELAEVQGETDDEIQNDWKYLVNYENIQHSTVLPEFIVNDESEGENDRPVVFRKKKRRRKRRQRDTVSTQSKTEELLPSPELYFPGPPIAPDLNANRPSWLGSHLGNYNICHTPYDEVNDEMTMFDQNLELIWQEDNMTNVDNFDHRDDALDEEVRSIFPEDLTPCDANFNLNASWSMNEIKQPVPPNDNLSSSRSVEEIRIGLKDKIEKLCRDKWELERKFDMVQHFQDRQAEEQASLVQNVNDYRQELVLHGLASAHKQLDSQLDRLQTSYDSLLGIKMKHFHDSSTASSSSMWQQSFSPNTTDTLFVEYENV